MVKETLMPIIASISQRYGPWAKICARTRRVRNPKVIRAVGRCDVVSSSSVSLIYFVANVETTIA